MNFLCIYLKNCEVYVTFLPLKRKNDTTHKTTHTVYYCVLAENFRKFF